MQEFQCHLSGLYDSIFYSELVHHIYGKDRNLSFSAIYIQCMHCTHCVPNHIENQSMKYANLALPKIRKQIFMMTPSCSGSDVHRPVRQLPHLKMVAIQIPCTCQHHSKLTCIDIVLILNGQVTCRYS